MSNPERLLSFTLVLLTMLNLLPQFLQVMKTRKTRDISTLSYTIITSSATLWVVYGFMRHDPTIIAANTVVALLAVGILTVKLKSQE